MSGEDSDLRLPNSRHYTTLKKLTLLRDRKSELGKKWKRRVSSLWRYQADFI